MKDNKITKRDLNRLVLDYLILEGYRTAAESFASEAATDLPSNAAQQVEEANIEMRIQIKEKVESGDVMGAIEMCNDLDPEILDARPRLHFHLLTQSLIELIRHGRTAEALMFAKTELAPRAERNEEFLKELESVMCLLVYGATGPGTGKEKSKDKAKEQDKGNKDQATGSVTFDAPPSLLELLSTQHRDLTASELNTALLASLSLGGPRHEPRLAELMRLCAWGENALVKNGVAFPRLEIGRGEGGRLLGGQEGEGVKEEN
ncbi:hypothetical protein M408DRAFT_332948 [Serendipita vermifera MAFF 305830]|uniref:CTLH domain-containing protein n=1 Tax=Serendipita vermifera MAFF 305830 TaxID=933852 RepID=A0A0C3ASW4_SERVB|nr:hypothetical protein M408DRAFT_332948 [Serendipita vermifera MAFF 305830]